MIELIIVVALLAWLLSAGIFGAITGLIQFLLIIAIITLAIRIVDEVRAT